MYVIKNAIKNVWRNKGRNVLIGVIILGILTATVVAFGINKTTSQIIKDYKAKFGSEVSISPNMEKIMNGEKGENGMPKVPEVSPEKYFDFGNSEYIKEALFNSSISGISDKIKAIDEDIDKNNKGLGSVKMVGNDSEEMVMPNFKISGNSDTESLAEFKEGKRKIIDGSMYKENNECIISKELAELNNIKVGDFIEIKNSMESKEGSYKLKVTGIYFDSTEEYESPFKMSSLNRRNEILCSIDTTKNMSKQGKISIQAKYLLKSPDMLEAFEKEIRDKGLPEAFDVSTDEDSYNKIVGPVEGLGSITVMFILVVLGLGSVILILLNTLSIRERKYEVGILRAIGMKKSKVALGLITESLIITIICLGIGLGVGSAVAQPVSNSLLAKQIEQQKKTNENVSGGNKSGMVVTNIGSKSSETEDTISNIDVSLDAETLLKVTAVAMILVLISSGVGVRYITKYEPRKILTERG